MVNSVKSWRPNGRVHGRWGWIDTAWVTSVWVTSLFQCTAAQLSITPDVVTAAVGDTVTLSVRREGRFRYCNWFRGAGTDAKDQILGLFGSDPPSYGPKYTGRESVLPDGSLRITDVLTDHSGIYTVEMAVNSGWIQVATSQLRVHALVTKPTVTMTSLQPVEYKDTVTVTCNTSGAAETILWFFDRQHLLIDNTRIVLSQDNQTLKLTYVTRLDSGIYQCKASNPISDITSDPQTLAVSYGPEDTRIDTSGTQILEAGESFSLSCYTRSVPQIDTYEWFINDISLTFNKPQLSVVRVSSKDEGNYTCVARNTATGKSAKASVFIAVKDVSNAIGILVSLNLSALSQSSICRLKQRNSTKPSNGQWTMHQRKSAKPSNGQWTRHLRKSTKPSNVQWTMHQWKNAKPSNEQLTLHQG
ncbi:cell adhesion molecule CEACAM6-like [Lissotriton helveticus]